MVRTLSLQLLLPTVRLSCREVQVGAEMAGACVLRSGVRLAGLFWGSVVLRHWKLVPAWTMDTSPCCLATACMLLTARPLPPPLCLLDACMAAGAPPAADA
jgi:hypothetical protein